MGELRGVGAPIEGLFDQLAAEYEEMRVDAGWDPWPHVEQLGSLEGLEVLDLGCASGEVCEALARGGSQVTGLDVSPQMLVQARKRLPKGRWVLHDLADPLPFEDASFDVVLALGCLEFVEEVEVACQEIARVLRPGGRALYVVELCGGGCARGEDPSVILYDAWLRHRRTQAQVEAHALGLWRSVELEQVEGYWDDEAERRVQYCRVLGWR